MKAETTGKGGTPRDSASQVSASPLSGEKRHRRKGLVTNAERADLAGPNHQLSLAHRNGVFIPAGSGRGGRHTPAERPHNVDLRSTLRRSHLGLRRAFQGPSESGESLASKTLLRARSVMETIFRAHSKSKLVLVSTYLPSQTTSLLVPLVQGLFFFIHRRAFLSLSSLLASFHITSQTKWRYQDSLRQM